MLGLNRWAFSTPDQFADDVRFAEDLGYSHALLGTNALRVWDCYVMLSLAARQTSSIRLSTFIDNVVLRHPAVVANSIATVDQISEGRAELGLGVGDTAVRFLGRTPSKVTELEDATVLIRRLLAGDEVDFGGSRAVRMHAARPVPVWLAAAGPRSLRAAGRVADGVYLRVGRHPANLRAALGAVHAGAIEAGRDPEEISVGLVLHTVTSQDPHEIRAIARAMAAGFYEYSPMLFDIAGLPWDGPSVHELKKQVWPDFHHAADLVTAGEFVDFLTDDAAEGFSVFGSAEDMADQIRGAIDVLGRVDVVVPNPVPSPEPAREFAAWFAQSVWSRV